MLLDLGLLTAKRDRNTTNLEAGQVVALVRRSALDCTT